MNETNFDNDMRADELFIESDLRDELRLIDAAPDDVPVWIENEDGSGQWSDGWTGDDLPLYTGDEDFPEFRSMDAFAPGVLEDYPNPYDND